MHRSLSPRARRPGFTLVELLIVISIIAILASLVITGLSSATQQKNKTEAKSTISSIVTALETFVMDEAKNPAFGKKPDPERNDFPELWTALMQPPPEGGRNYPYLENITKDNIVVQVDEGRYERATREEVEDPSIDKYLLDPWGNPYVYRCNKGLEPEPWMINPRGVDIYSFGPNGVDDTIVGTTGEENDDITN